MSAGLYDDDDVCIMSAFRDIKGIGLLGLVGLVGLTELFRFIKVAGLVGLFLPTCNSPNNLHDTLKGHLRQRVVESFIRILVKLYLKSRQRCMSWAGEVGACNKLSPDKFCRNRVQFGLFGAINLRYW